MKTEEEIENEIAFMLELIRAKKKETEKLKDEIEVLRAGIRNAEGMLENFKPCQIIKHSLDDNFFICNYCYGCS